MMVAVIWTNIVVEIWLLYAFFQLKSVERKTFTTRVKIFFVVLAITGIIATFGKNLIYLLTSGLIAYAATVKDTEKGNGSIKVD